MRRASKLPHWPPHLPGVHGWFHWRIVPKLALALCTIVMLTALVFMHLDYYQVGSRLEQFRAGQPAPQDIIAPSTVRWEDIDETSQKRDEAAKLVPSQYAFDPKALVNAHAELDRLFSQLHANSVSSESQDNQETTDFSDIRDSAKQIDDVTWNRLHNESWHILNSVMQSRIEEGSGRTDAETRIADLAQRREHNTDYQRILTVVTKNALQPTWIIDETKTKTQQQHAREQIAPVIRTFRRGEVILRRGDLITTNDLQQLMTNQLLTPAPLAHLIPLAMIFLFAVTAFGVFLHRFVPAIFQNDRKLLLLASLIIAVIWVMVTLGGEHESLVGLMAIPAGCMAIAGLLGLPTAIVSTMVLSMTAGLAADHQLAMVILTMGSAITGIMAVSYIWPANRAIPAVVSLVAVNVLLLISINLILPGGEFSSVWSQIGRFALEATAGGLGATFIAVGSIYILARPFGITTHYRLMELSNPNEPLLRKMMIEAPGSYHSSVMVANIAEAAADAVGANSLLTRVAALYHDVGKLKRPGFFVENQAPLGIENVHQKLSPKLSYLILTSHVKEGVEIAREYKLPEEILSIIREHHGTTLAAYFYHRALSEAGEEGVSEHEFRYPGPKPSSRESAIVMLSDSVQASVKSLKEPTPNRIENMVHDIINSRLNDGQLEDCDITLRDLRQLSQVFIRILTGLYTYTRIEYPDIKGEGTRARANLNSETTPTTSEPIAPAPSS
ncbi:MAG TPA: HDIG domain-containing protein [Armatimonadota bacterium]|nr:HDIG domain-containing protein [Armatimonadota bacterium]